jgi:parallel beta-helix repeat protein
MRNFARVPAAFAVCLVIAFASPALGSIVRVKWDSPTNGPGNDWDHAYHTVTAGLSAAVSGNEVWVAGDAAHPYIQCINLKAGVGLYGGFVGTETSRDQRDWQANITVLHGSGGFNGTVTPQSGATASTIIDGFTIRNGGMGGVYCDKSSPTISHNTITENSNGGIYCEYDSSPIICNNTITLNTSGCRGGGGILCDTCSPTIANNTITANAAVDGGGIYCYYSSPAIVNNTITANSANGGGGIFCNNGSPTISNNTVAFNSSGVYNSGGNPTLANNCVYNPGGLNYSGLSANATNIQSDPNLVAAEYGKIHIQPYSPCKDTGANGVVQPGWTDMDGQARIQGTRVDIGADESDGTTWTFAPVIIRVSPSGDDANDGSSWALTKRTVQAGIDAASAQGGEVWVAAGTYYGSIKLPAYLYLYGGFAGTESSRNGRSWSANTTVLDGGGTQTVVQALLGHRVSCIDGFVIRNGGGYGGSGGILCIGAPAISNNTIMENYGGGISCNMGSAIVANNIITANVSNYGAGVYCHTGCPVIINNTVEENRATYGAGIYCFSGSPAVSNNIVAFNSSGIYSSTGSSPVLRNNCVYNPTGANYSGLTAGTGDISLDPSVTSDYHLLSNSPCVNAGWNSAAGITTYDIDGQPRLNGVIDIGADEYWVDFNGAKLAGDGSGVYIAGAVVTAAFPDFFYIESDNRACGIRVNKTGHSLASGMRAYVVGAPSTTSGERCIAASDAHRADPPNDSGAVDPLGLTNKALGGGTFGLQGGVWGWVLTSGTPPRTWQQISGLNNIGLLVRTCGKVVEIDSASPATWFKIDDGSGVNVKCLVGSGVTVNPSWTYVGVTGISSCETVGAELHSLLRVRVQGDIVAY